MNEWICRCSMWIAAIYVFNFASWIWIFRDHWRAVSQIIARWWRSYHPSKRSWDWCSWQGGTQILVFCFTFFLQSWHYLTQSTKVKAFLFSNPLQVKKDVREALGLKSFTKSNNPLPKTSYVPYCFFDKVCQTILWKMFFIFSYWYAGRRKLLDPSRIWGDLVLGG